MASVRLLAVVAIALALLSGCKKEIYHGLTEDEANEVLVTLKQSNPPIIAEKVLEGTTKAGMIFTITVDEQYAVEAMRIMLDNNLPRKQDKGLEKVFETPSMIPTETEEKSRQLFALQNDLANSLEQIAGIVDARVHLVLPEMSPLEGRDVTPARAAALVKYREKPRAGETEADAKKELAEWRLVLMALNEDLRKMKKLWMEDLPRTLASDQRHFLTLDQYVNTKRGDDPEGKEARLALEAMKKTFTERLGIHNALQSLPKLKDMDALISKTEKVQLESLGFTSATIRSLIANATPRLLEDNVAVEFTKVVPKPPPGNVTASPKDWKAEYFLYAAAAAAGLALALVGMGVWVMSLRGKIASLEAKAKGAPAAMSASAAGGAPPG